MSAVKYGSQYIITDVTTVKFIGQWIIAGIGGCIHVFETQSGKFITREKIFEGQRVHNIFAGRNQNIAVIGGKMVRIFKLEREGNFVLSTYASWAADDWIQYLHWLDCGNIAIVTAHNVVSLWNSRTGEKEREIFCEVNCILYCALLDGLSWSDLVVFTGTVFQQILIWAPASVEEDTVNSPVLHTLKGHDGVIFSVSYDPDSNYICSTSDDRSVRLWSVDLQLSDDCNRVTQWKEATITLLHTMYGHTARVWRNIIIDNVIISVGEDSCLCVWRTDGSLQKYWKTHQGANVWSVDCSKEKNLIVTGGGDGGISLWPLHTESAVPNFLTFSGNLFTQDFCSMKGQNGNFPRRIGLTSKDNVVAITDSGCLLYCTVVGRGQGNWKLMHQDEKLASYCLLEMSPCRQYVALASMDGHILIFKDCSSVHGKGLILNVEEKAVVGRIFSLHWLSSDNLLSCGPNGILEMWKLGHPQWLQKMNEFELPKSKERWISAAALRENFLVCGDRNGSIHLFKIVDNQTNSIQCPSQSFYKIHGRLGVSSLIWYGNCLYSTGRDGTVRRYLMLENEGRLECLNADKLPMEWPATTSLSAFGLLVLGFRAANFVIWSHVERRNVLTIPCGGGHRSWDWTLEGHTFRFIYVKDKMVHMYTCMMNEIIKPALQSGFHSKQISCIRQIPLLKDETGNSHNLLLSASEDTTVRLSVISNSNVLHTVTVLQSHISSVRALAVYQMRDSVLVFSGGGRAQLKVWKLVIQSAQGSVPQVKCQELSSHMLKDSSKKNKKPWLSVERTVDPETRYMDLCAVVLQCQDPDKTERVVLLAAGCSDGFLR
ncbi:hypothetical protein B7P43_G16418 [Cryptotermes secundus]|nr:hypothetical protein B7P43_G16418 [Cryptotermes secundus]